MMKNELAAKLSTAFLKTHPDAAARLLEGEQAEASSLILSGCAPEIAAKVLGGMAPHSASAILAFMQGKHLNAVISALPLAVASNLVIGLPPDRQSALLNTLPGDLRASLQRMLSYPRDSVGAVMDPDPFCLPADLTVEEALHRIREHHQQIHYYLYIVNREQQLAGVLNLRDFILASPKQNLAGLMQVKVASLRPETPLAIVEKTPDWGRYLALPVMDETRRFLGVLSLESVQRAKGTFSKKPQSGWNTLLALNELYWVGLSGMLGATATPPPATQDDSQLSKRSSP